MTPQQILQWAIDNLPSLYQTTAFGLTGLAAADMLAKLTPKPPPLIFIDTLYHFPETIDLKNEVERKYGHPVHVYRPDGVETTLQFEQKYGEKLWETNELFYDYLVKVSSFRQNSCAWIDAEFMALRLSQQAELTRSLASSPS